MINIYPRNGEIGGRENWLPGVTKDNIFRISKVVYDKDVIVKHIKDLILEELADNMDDCKRAREKLSALLSEYMFFVKNGNYKHEKEDRILALIPHCSYHNVDFLRDVVKKYELEISEEHLHVKISKDRMHLEVILSPHCKCSEQEVKDMIAKYESFDKMEPIVSKSKHP